MSRADTNLPAPSKKAIESGMRVLVMWNWPSDGSSNVKTIPS
jgi:hypothetical protein